MRKRHILGILATLVAGVMLPVPAHSTELCTGDDIIAIEFLGKADCYWYPEAQTVLIDTLKSDSREKVRYAAVMAITAQLQRGKAPLDATSGWRKVPDPEICTQICRLAHFERPLTREELYRCYKIRQEACLKNRGEICHDCCTPEALEALARTAFEKDLFGCWVEPSERIRWRAERALSLCCSQSTMEGYSQQYNQDPNMAPPSLGQTPGAQDNTAQPAQPGVFGQEVQGNFSGNLPPILGRADFSNRFNIFDNMSAAPRSRVWYGFQYIETQNNAIFTTGDTNKLFAILNTAAGRAQFISLTGFGREPGQSAVNPNSSDAKQELQDRFLVANGGRTQAFTQSPDSVLHRFGTEWALTTDFSITLMGQYVVPIEGDEQPNSFSNPLIQLKHVFYRSEDTLFSGSFSIQPQISRPQFGIGEDTTRLSPGLLYYRSLSEKVFTQNAVGFSFPTESNQITTFDFALGLGVWAYKHESLEPYYRGPKPNQWILGFIPQFEVLGKTIIGNNISTTSFNLNGGTAQTALGTVNPIDGTRTIYFAQDFNPFRESAFVYRESRTNIDITVGASTLFKNNFVFSAAVSTPVTGGNARALEFISSLNKYF